MGGCCECCWCCCLAAACISASISAIVRGRIGCPSVGVKCALITSGDGAGEALTRCPSGLPCEKEPNRRAEGTGEDGAAAAIDPFREYGWLAFCELLKRRSDAADLLPQRSFAIT